MRLGFAADRPGRLSTGPDGNEDLSLEGMLPGTKAAGAKPPAPA